MTPTELNAYEKRLAEYDKQLGDNGPLMAHELLQVSRELLCALRSQTLPFHLASDFKAFVSLEVAPEAETPVIWAIHYVGSVKKYYVERITKFWGNPVLGAVGYIAESDLLAAFTAWQSTQGDRAHSRTEGTTAMSMAEAFNALREDNRDVILITNNAITGPHVSIACENAFEAIGLLEALKLKLLAQVSGQSILLIDMTDIMKKEAS